MRTTPSILAATALILLVAKAVSAQADSPALDSGEVAIRGVVRREADQKPVPGAWVRLDGTRRAAITDSAGGYLLRHVESAVTAPHPYQVTVSVPTDAPRYYPETRMIAPIGPDDGLIIVAGHQRRPAGYAGQLNFFLREWPIPF